MSFVDYNPSYINLFDKASVYDVLIHNSKIYLATNSGVYYADMSLNNIPGTYYNFIKLNGIQGQTWSVTLASNDVIIGHDNGLFVLDGLKPIKIGSESGFWKITPIEGNENSYLASNYTGLFLLKKIADKWEIVHKIKGFDESARDILPSGEKNTYWICHGYQGVFKVHLNQDFTKAIEKYIPAGFSSAMEQYIQQGKFISPDAFNGVTQNSFEVRAVPVFAYGFTTDKGGLAKDAVVTTVEEDASVLKAGLQKGDVLKGYSIYGDPSKEAKLFVLRNDKRVEITFYPTVNKKMLQLKPGNVWLSK